MVGSAGNAPVRRFRLCFLTPDLQSGSRITSLGIGSGGGSCTHGGKAYEAHLNLILPAVKLVESVGNAPTSTCLQGRCIPCLPRPQEKLASRPGAAPGKLSFGDSAAQAGARLNRNWCGCRELHPDILRGGETFWLLNHSRKESKRAGSNHAPGPCHFNKEQTPLSILRYQPTVSRW